MTMIETSAHHYYAIQTTSGHENKVMAFIQRKIDQDPALRTIA